MICPTQQHRGIIADAISHDAKSPIGLNMADELFFKAQMYDFQKWLNNKVTTNFKFTDEQLQELKEHSTLTKHDGSETIALDNIISKYKEYKAGVKNKVFNTLEVEQAFVDYTVSAIYKTLGQEVIVNRNGVNKHVFVSELTIKDIKANPKLDIIPLLLANIKKDITQARKSVLLYDNVIEHLDKFKEDPFRLIEHFQKQNLESNQRKVSKDNITEQYNQLKVLGNNYQAIKSFIENKLNSPIFKQQSEYLKDIKNNRTAESILEQARVKLKQTYGDSFNTISELTSSDNNNQLSKDYDDKNVYNRDVADSFNQIVINVINSIPYRSIDNEGNAGLIVNPYTNLREHVKFTEVHHNLKWKLANPQSPKHLIELMRLNRHQYLWLDDLADFLEQTDIHPKLIEGFFTYFNNTLTPEHVALIQNEGVDRYTTSMRMLSPALGQELSDSIIGNIMDIRKNIEKIEQVVDKFKQYEDQFLKQQRTINSNLPLNPQIKDLFVDIRAMLKLYDIEVDDKLLYKIVRGETLKAGKEYTISNIYQVLNDNIRTPLNYITKHFKDNEVFNDLTNLNRITNLIVNYDEFNIEASYHAADGATKHGVRLPNGLSDFVKMLQKSTLNEVYQKELLDTLSNIAEHPGYAESNWLVTRQHGGQIVQGFLNKVINKDGTFTYELNKEYLAKIMVTLDGGIKHVNSTEASIFKELEDKDYALSQLIAFIDNHGTARKGDITYLGVPILSDSSNHSMITMHRIRARFGTDFTLTNNNNDYVIPTTSNVVSIGYQKFLQELRTMEYDFNYLFDIKDGKIITKPNINNLITYEHKHFKFENGKRVYLKNGLPIGNVFKFNVFEGINDIVKIDEKGIPSLLNIDDKAIRELIANNFVEEATRLRNDLKNLQQFLPDTTDTHKDGENHWGWKDLKQSDIGFNKLILEFALNGFVANTELQNFIFGNLDEFSSSMETVKRSKIASTPAIESYLGRDITIMTFSDILRDSDMLEYYKVMAEVELDKRGITTENPSYQRFYNDTVKGYMKSKVTDGQSLYSTNFYVAHLQSLLRFEQYEHLFETYEKNGRINYRFRTDVPFSEIKNAITVVKSLFGNRSMVNNDGHLTMVSNQIKTSALPISDNLFKGSVMSQLAEWMNDNNVDVVTFKSSQKQMVTGETNVANNEKVFDVNDLVNVPKVIIPGNSYKVVLDVVDHTQDSENKTGIQFMKLIFGNLDYNALYDIYDENGNKLTGKQVFDLGQSLYSRKIINSATKLFNELGVEIVDGRYIIKDKTKLSETLERDVKTRGYSDVELKSILLELSNTGNDFNLPLYFSTFNKRWQNVLTALFTNNITNQKLPGSHIVLISNVFKGALDGTEINSRDLKSYIELDGQKIDTHGYTKAQFEELINKGGKLILEAYISPFSEDFFDKDGNLIPIEQLENSPLLKNLGYRIPSSGKHSVAMLKVIGWLPMPYSAGIIVADDIVNATGTDFDVDSLFMIHKHFVRTEDKDGNYSFNVIGSDNNTERQYINYVHDNINKRFKDYDVNIMQFNDKLNSIYSEFKNTLKLERNNNLPTFDTLIEEGKDIFFSLPTELQNNYKEFENSLKSNNIKGIMKAMQYAERTRAYLEQSEIPPSLRVQLEALLKNEEDIVKMYGIREELYNQYKEIFKNRLPSVKEEQVKVLQSSEYQLALAKTIASVERLDDYDTFLTKPYAERLSDEEIDNKLIDIFEGILTDKHHTLERIRPAAFNEHEEMTKLFPTDMTGNPSWISTQFKYRSASSAGKRGLSIAASINASLFVYQNVNGSFNLPLHYTYILNTPNAHIKYAELKKQMGDTMFNRMLLNTTMEQLREKYPNVIVNEDGSVTIAHERIAKNNKDYTNIENGLITDTVGELVDYTVDAVKNPLPNNLNQHSIMWALTMEAIGIRSFDSITFLQLPVVSEVIQYIKDTKFVLGTKYNAISSIAYNYKFILQSLYQASIGGKILSNDEYNDRIQEVLNNNQFKLNSVSIMEEYYDKDNITNNTITKLMNIAKSASSANQSVAKLLRDYVLGNNNNKANITSDEINKLIPIVAKRINMLSSLEYIDGMSGLLSASNKALSTDKVGISPTLTDAHILLNDIETEIQRKTFVKLDKNIIPIQSIVQHGTLTNVVSSVYTKDSKQSTYSSFANKLDYALKIPLEILQPLFISETPLFSKLHSTITEEQQKPDGLFELADTIFSMGVQAKQAIMGKVYNHTMQHLMQDIEIFQINNEDASAILGINDKDNTKPYHIQTLTEQIKYIKNKLNIKHSDNHILNYLTIQDSQYDKRVSKIDKIILKRISNDASKNLYIKQLTDLYFKGFEEKLMVLNMIKYSYLTDGLMFKSNTIAQLIDVIVWQDLKVPEQLRKIHERAKDNFAVSSLGNSKIYFREFMLNNLHDNSIAPIIKLTKFNYETKDGHKNNKLMEHILKYNKDTQPENHPLVLWHQTIRRTMHELMNTYFFKVWYKNSNGDMELAYFEKVAKVHQVDAKEGQPYIDGRVMFLRVNPNGTKYVSNFTEDSAPVINTTYESDELTYIKRQALLDNYNNKVEQKNQHYRNVSLLNDDILIKEEEKVVDENVATYDVPYTDVTEQLELPAHDNNEQFHRLNNLPRLSKQQQEEHASNLKATFAEQGIDVEVKWDNLNGGNSKVKEIDGKLVIIIDPERARQDSVYHEFGHILVDMSQDQEFIKAGIEQLRGGELWNKVKFLYKDLTDEQLGREVLTSAIGIEAVTNDFSNDKGWKFWFNRLLQRISNFIYKITNGKVGNEINIARELARRLTNGDIRVKVNAQMSEKEQWQRSEEYVEDLTKVHEYLNKVKSVYTDILNKNKYNVTPEGDALRRNMEEGIATISLEALESNINYIYTANAIANVRIISQRELNRFEANLIEQVNIFNNPKLDIRNFDNESINRLTETMYQVREFIANYNEVETLDIKQMPNSMSEMNAGTLKGEELQVYLAYKRIEQTLSDIKKDDLPRIKELKLKYNVLSNILRVWIISHTNNPNVTNYLLESKATQFDDNSFQSTFLSIGDSHHIMVANLAKIIRTANDKRDKEYAILYREFMAAWNKYKSNGGNAKKLFDKFGRLHTEYNREQFWTDAMTYVNSPGIIVNGVLQKNKLKDFIEDNVTFASQETINKAIDEQFEKMKNNEISSREYSKWMLDNVRRVDSEYGLEPTYKADVNGIFATLNEKYRNKEYDAIKGADLEMYNTLKTLYDKLFKGLGTAQSKYFLPNIVDKGKQKELEARGDWFESDSDPTITNVTTNANNEQVHQIPMSYVGLAGAQPMVEVRSIMKGESINDYENSILKDIKIRYNLEFNSLKELKQYNDDILIKNKLRHGEAVNYNLEEVIPRLIWSLSNYKSRKDIEGLILMASANLKEEQLATKNGYGKTILSRVTNLVTKEQKPATILGANSKIYEHLIKTIEMTVYDKFMKPSTGMNTLKALRQYQSLLGLGFNLHAGIKNITFGATQSLLLGNAGTFYSNKDLAAANMEYNSAIGSYFTDARRKDGKYTSEQNAIINEFNIISSYNELMEFDEGGTMGYAKKIFSNAAFAMQESGEHLLQHTLLFAMMRSHRLINGRFVTLADMLRDNLKVYTKQDIIDGKTIAELKQINDDIRKSITAKFEAAPTVKDMYSFEDGVLTLKEEYKDIQDELYQFKQRVRGVSHKLHGIYNKEDKGTIENTILGQLLMQFRRWAPAGWVNRFGSRGGMFNSEVFWNERRADSDIGTYTALFKFIMSPTAGQKYFDKEKPLVDNVTQGIMAVLKDYSHFVGNVRLYYNTMTVLEQREATRAMQELGVFIGLIIAYVGLKSLGDDDKELRRSRLFNFLLYQISALRAETGTFVPIYGWLNEANKFFKSPTATWKLGVNFLNIGYDVMQYPFRDEGNYFKGGVHNKELKLKVHTLDVVPGVTQVDRIFNENRNEIYGLYR